MIWSEAVPAFWAFAASSSFGAADAAPSSSPVLREDDFRLAERDGVVAVFSPAGSELPREITDIRVALLPAADRERLQAGILAGDRRELAMLLEDLGS